MQFDQKNLVVAIVLSIAIVLGFEFLYNLPRMEKQRALQAEQAASQTQTQTVPTPTTPPSLAPGASPPPAAQPAPTVPPLQQPRVKISAARVEGSIRLAGGRIDDLKLKDYRETVDPTSALIV